MKLFLMTLSLLALAACTDPAREELKWQCYGSNTTPRVTTQTGIQDNVPYYDCAPTPTYERPQRMEGR